MPQRRLTEEHMIRIVREAEAPGEQVREVCRRYGIAEQTVDRWRHRYGGREVAEAVRRRHLERANARLKTLVAERDLELEVRKAWLAPKW